jgi:uncharacterized protein (UPF0303 family)
MTVDELMAEAETLILPRFDEALALRLGQLLVDLAKGLPVVINIRSAHRCLFHAALPGSAADNDNWARRKSNTALTMGRSSLLTGTRLREKGGSLPEQGYAVADFADHGGAVPLVVAGVGMVAVATVSGLPQVEDHKLVAAGIRALLAEI